MNLFFESEWIIGSGIKLFVNLVLRVNDVDVVLCNCNVFRLQSQSIILIFLRSGYFTAIGAGVFSLIPSSKANAVTASSMVGR